MKQTEFVSKCADNTAFTALLNCAEARQRNRISSKLPISVSLSFFVYENLGAFFHLAVDADGQI